MKPRTKQEILDPLALERSSPSGLPKKFRRNPPNRHEAVKKFRHREMGRPGDARGRGNFLPPKQAIISPWPARCGTRGSLRILCLDLLEFPQVAHIALRKPAQCFKALYLPPGFDGRKFPLPRATKEAFASLRSIFSHLPFKKMSQGRIRVYLCSSVSKKNSLVAVPPPRGRCASLVKCLFRLPPPGKPGGPARPS
jgi:hypothetical protein